MSLVIVLVVVALGLVTLAWIDAGREEQRLIETPALLPEAAT